MSSAEELSDAELVRGLRAGDRGAFEALCARYDDAVLNAARRELGGHADSEHRAREVADLLWLDLCRRPDYLSHHDYARRPLGSYLAKLARGRAKRFLGKLRRKEKSHPEFPFQEDFVDPLSELVKRWDEVVDLLSAKQLARLRRILQMKKRREADQAWYERLVRKVRQQLDLAPRRRSPKTRSSKEFPKKP